MTDYEEVVRLRAALDAAEARATEAEREHDVTADRLKHSDLDREAERAFRMKAEQQRDESRAERDEINAARTAAEQQVAELRGRVALLTHPLLTDKERALRDTVVDMAALLREAEAALDAAREETARVRRLLAEAMPVHYAGECGHCALDELPPETCPTLQFIATCEAALTPTPPQPAARTEEG